MNNIIDFKKKKEDLIMGRISLDFCGFEEDGRVIVSMRERAESREAEGMIIPMTV